MKFFCRKFLTAFMFLFFAFNAKAVNDTLTIGQAFDWSVGDTLIYRQYFETVFAQPIITYQGLKGFTVTARTDYTDSIVYQVKYIDNTPDSIVINMIDSPVTAFKLNNSLVASTLQCDTYALDCQLDSHIDSINSFLTTYFYVYTQDVGSCATFKEKVGLWNRGFLGNGFQVPPVGNGIFLVYYSSGSFSWMDTALYNGISEQIQQGTTSFHLFPNPASDELTITTEAEDVYSVLVYDIMGNCVAAPKNFFDNLFHIKVNHLAAGYYYLKLTGVHSYSTTKGFIVAR